MRRRTVLATALAAAAAPGVARAAAPGPSVIRTGATTLDGRAIYFVSYDGLVNNNSFQKNGLLTYKGYQYAVWYTADRNAVVGRRALGASTWQTVKAGHTLRYDDSHNVISMGVSEIDGRLHLNMDSHSDGFTYVKSVAGLVDDPAGLSWTASRFGAPQSTLDGLALTSRFTYPQFITTPEGRLQLSYRAGVSGNGRNALAEYDGTRWTALGEWTSSTGTYRSEHGSSTARNMYLHGIDYDRGGLAARLLHLAGAGRRGDVRERRHHQPRHRLRLVRRPRAHLAERRGHGRRCHRRRRPGLRDRHRSGRGSAEPRSFPDEPGESVHRLRRAGRTRSSPTCPAASASAPPATSRTAPPTAAPSTSAKSPPAAGGRPRSPSRSTPASAPG
ncbi:hypothetical protein SGLAM104S_05485 [Streptomyces glaucescens]